MQLGSVCVWQESIMHCYVKESIHVVRATGHDIEVHSITSLQ
jgi:hypothetical protein